MAPALKHLLSTDQKRVLWHLRRHGATPRVEIATKLGMHAGPMTRVTRELLTLGFIEENEHWQAVRGRPVIPLALAATGGYAAGATVHAGWFEIVLLDFTGGIIDREAVTFESDDPRKFVEILESHLRRLSIKSTLFGGRFLGLGIAVPGPITRHSPHRRHTVQWLAGWRDVNLPDFFEDALGIPVVVENEATAAGLAEYYDSGLIRSCGTAMIFFIGHGVGGSVISTRNLLRGENGNAGEVGRLFSTEKPRPSAVDLLACLKAAGAPVSNLRDVEPCLETHHSVIVEWVDRAARQLDFAATAGVGWLDPGAVILSGVLPTVVLNLLGERLAVSEWRAEQSWMPRIAFHVSRLGSWAAAIGAALLPIHQITAEVHEQGV
jgi:predicted NBD/HSP70 family sugar kinase